jgi:hypothetical protein
MKNFVMAIFVAGLLATTTLGTAFAQTCSSYGERCVADGHPKAKCASTTRTCINACKKGTKVWVGFASGKHYPVTSCE